MSKNTKNFNINFHLTNKYLYKRLSISCLEKKILEKYKYKIKKHHLVLNNKDSKFSQLLHTLFGVFLSRLQAVIVGHFNQSGGISDA